MLQQFVGVAAGRDPVFYVAGSGNAVGIASPSVLELGAVTIGYLAIAVGHEVELSVLGVELFVGCCSPLVLHQSGGVAVVRRCCSSPSVFSSVSGVAVGGVAVGDSTMSGVAVGWSNDVGALGGGSFASVGSIFAGAVRDVGVSCYYGSCSLALANARWFTTWHCVSVGCYGSLVCASGALNAVGIVAVRLC